MIRFSAVSTFLLFLGCGGGGGGGGDSSPQPQNQNLAPASVSGEQLTLSGTSQRTIAFSSSGNDWSEDQNGTARSGTYAYTATGSSADLTLTESGSESTIRLTFTAPDSGAYVAGQDSGTFHLQALQSDPPSSGTPPPGDIPEGLAPASLDGHTLFGTRTFTSTGPVGQTHVYTFSTSTYHDSDPPEETDGRFIYEPAGNHASLVLNYTSPKGFDGDRHEMALTFIDANNGTFESVYTRRDGTVIQINGTFRID